MLTIFLWSNAWFSCIDGVAGIMPIITCPSCNLTNPRFCRKTGLVANTRLFGFICCRLLRRHLGFDSDFAQISGLKIGGWQLWLGGPKPISKSRVGGPGVLTCCAFLVTICAKNIQKSKNQKVMKVWGALGGDVAGLGLSPKFYPFPAAANFLTQGSWRLCELRQSPTS